MEFETITYAVQGTTAIVTLNRPEKRNALSGKLLRELNAALLEADEHNAVHCVVLRGAGPHFCAGADLTEFSSRARPGVSRPAGDRRRRLAAGTRPAAAHRRCSTCTSR